MRRTLYIDPGMKCTGLALYHDATLVHVRAVRSSTLSEACDDRLGNVDLDAAVIELPQIYAAGVQKADPNDIVALAVIAGAYASAAASAGASLAWKRPAEWKGQAPKDIVHARMHAVLTPWESKLFEGLKLPRGMLHNVYDAVSMGLVSLGRMK